ncbi:hypothetical protein RRG08_006849 [Elysia crispata]|uniref:Uncharacterized protein n=1 Tax=Elysia crispata TaxID=231223 RepID=A0AAE1CMW8_9GAST|nr:hypothetical protein RRG08_006849 [Elysia crispata]
MSEVNCLVDDGESRLIYDRAAPELQGKLKFRFDFNDAGGGKETGILQMLKNGEVVRYHQSRPFPAGSLKLKKIDENEVACIVKLKKVDTSINLNDFFTN